MLENLYTTKMSMDKKKLQNRFSKIRSKNGRISKLMALAMAVVVAGPALVVFPFFQKYFVKGLTGGSVKG